jgi:hypothetical protein
MEASPRSLLKVFQPDIQYVVPIFQRRYVWNENDQWAELWEDILDIIADVEQVEALVEAGADQPLPSPFLGPSSAISPSRWVPTLTSDR